MQSVRPNDCTQGEDWDLGLDGYIEDSYMPEDQEWEDFVEQNDEFIEYIQSIQWQQVTEEDYLPCRNKQTEERINNENQYEGKNLGKQGVEGE